MRKSRPPSQRQLRVGEALRHALVDVLAQGGLRDPALRGKSITVSEVRISPDLKNAKAYVMPLGGDDDQGEFIAALQRAAPYLRGAVARITTLKHTPKFSFEIDQSFMLADEVDNLLRRPQVARDLLHGGGANGS
jgi:ribosome-binding factor A